MKEYRLLEQGEPTSEDREIRPTLSPSCQASQPIIIFLAILGAVLLFVSACGNVFQYWYSGYGNDDTCRSQIGGSAALDGMERILLRWVLLAGVAGGVMRPFMINTDWSSKNTTRADELWKDLAPNVGMVAIDNDVSRNMDLYSTEPFPWDSSKGVYMLEGYHSLHCLVRLYLHICFLLGGPVNNHGNRCTYTEHCVSLSRASHRPHRCVTISTASTRCGKMQSALRMIRCGRPVATWGSRRMLGDGRTSSAGTGISWRDGRCSIRHVSSGSPMGTLNARLSKSGGGVPMGRRIIQPLKCILVVRSESCGSNNTLSRSFRGTYN